MRVLSPRAQLSRGALSSCLTSATLKEMGSQGSRLVGRYSPERLREAGYSKEAALPGHSDAAVLRSVSIRRFMYGPYRCPHSNVGEAFLCRVHGLQVVAGWSGPMQWPTAKARGGRPRLIVAGDLIRALKQETSDTVALHWGVCRRTVANWRKALGLSAQMTDAGLQFRQANMRRKRATKPTLFVAPGQKYIESLDSTRRRELGQRTAAERMWKPEEIELLRTLPNRLAAQRLNRSIRAIGNARIRYGIAAPTNQQTCPRCGYVWRSYKDSTPISCARCSCRLAHIDLTRLAKPEVFGDFSLRGSAQPVFTS